MRTLQIDINPKDTKDYFGRLAKESDCSTLIDEDVTILDQTGKAILLYKQIDADTSELLNAVSTLKYGIGTRTGGLESRSAIFGYRPRNALRNDYCSSTAMAREFASQHRVIADFGKVLAQEYATYLSKTYEEHQELIKQKVKDEWVIEDTPFTSGIVNKNNQLGYHKDSGNFAGLYSNMIVLKQGVDGGRLAIPELDILVECKDNTIVYFDGQSLIHGVTPIKKQHKDAYRYTLVYYSLQQMWKCEGIDNELLRINQRQYLKAKKKYGG